MSDVQTAEQLWVKAHELVKAGQLAHAVRDLARCYEILKAAQDPRLSQVHRRWIEVHQVYLRRSEKAKKAKESAAKTDAVAPAAAQSAAEAPSEQILGGSESHIAPNEVLEVADELAGTVESQSGAPVPAVGATPAPAQVPSDRSAIPADDFLVTGTESPEPGPTSPAEMDTTAARESETPPSRFEADATKGNFDEETLVAEPESDSEFAFNDQSVTDAVGDAHVQSEDYQPHAGSQPIATAAERAHDLATAVGGDVRSFSASRGEAETFQAPQDSLASAGAGGPSAVLEFSAESGAQPVEAWDDESDAADDFFDSTTSVDRVGVGMAPPIHAFQPESGVQPAGTPNDGHVASEDFFDSTTSSAQPAWSDAETISANLPRTGAVLDDAQGAQPMVIAGQMDDVAFLEALLQRMESRRRAVGG